MITRTVTIVNKLGLHARAASVFVKTASRFEAEIKISNSRKEADGKSIMAVLMLQTACGSKVTLTANGADENEAMETMVELIDNRFGEAE